MATLNVKPHPTPLPSLKPQKSHRKVEIPVKAADPLGGIISYLTKKHGGSVQEKGIVTITSQSTHEPRWALTMVAALVSDSYVWSNNEPGQSACWNFHEMRVRPTHYAIRAYVLKSWVVEGSLDGSSWTEIDRQTGNQDFDGKWRTVSFAVSNPAEFRFIRLTQTDKNHCGADELVLDTLEFFGTLSE
jgi:hypothetical protein